MNPSSQQGGVMHAGPTAERPAGYGDACTNKVIMPQPCCVCSVRGCFVKGCSEAMALPRSSKTCRTAGVQFCQCVRIHLHVCMQNLGIFVPVTYLCKASNLHDQVNKIRPASSQQGCPCGHLTVWHSTAQHGEERPSDRHAAVKHRKGQCRQEQMRQYKTASQAAHGC